MSENFERCFPEVVNVEGGFSDHPADPGGATMRGVTLKTFRTHMGDESLTAEDLRQISPETVKDIYRKYWERWMDELPFGLGLLTFSMSINAGVYRARLLAQEAVGAAADGDIGPMTKLAIRQADPATACVSFHDARMKYYRSLTATWKHFGTGWTNRARHELVTAMRWTFE